MRAPPRRPRPGCTKTRSDSSAPACLPCRPADGGAVQARERLRTARRQSSTGRSPRRRHERTRAGTQSRSARRMAMRPRARLLRDSEAKAALGLVRVNRGAGDGGRGTKPRSPSIAQAVMMSASSANSATCSPRRLPGSLQLRQAPQDPTRPHTARIYLQDLDRRPGSLQARPNPSHHGTVHLVSHDTLIQGPDIWSRILRGLSAINSGATAWGMSTLGQSAARHSRGRAASRKV